MSSQTVGWWTGCGERLGGSRWAAGGFSHRARLAVLLLLAVALAVRVVAMIRMPLVPEEAYYWMYSQHPSLSYFDHPPMVAWIIGLGTALFGNTEFGVRFAGALLMLAASGLLYVFGRMWFGRQAALAAAVLLLVLPVYYGVGMIATMDSALVFFWLLCMVGTSVALREGRAWGWYLAGVGLGAAMLSKYTGVFVGFGALLAVIAHRPWRWHLRTPHPYLAGLLAAVMFLPVVVWNAQNDWASFRFQFTDRFQGHTFNPVNPLSYLAIQLFVATPVVLAGAAWLYARVGSNRRRLLTPRWLLAVCFSAPLLAVMSYKSLSYGIRLNWTLPLYLSLLPAIAQLGFAYARRARKPLQAAAWPRAALATLWGCSCLNILVLVYLLALEPSLHLIAAVGPWRELATLVEKVEQRLEDETGQVPLVIGEDKYRLASILAFYRTPLEHDVRASDFTTSQWILKGRGLGYPYWAKRQLWATNDCVIVNDANDIERCAPYFKEFILVDQFRLGRATYRIAIGRGRRS